MITFDGMLNEQMNDEEFRKEYEAIKSEMDAIRKIVDSRISEICTPDKITKCKLSSSEISFSFFDRSVFYFEQIIRSTSFRSLILLLLTPPGPLQFHHFLP